MRGDRAGLAGVAGSVLGFATLPVLAKLALGAGARVWPLVAWRFGIAAAAVWAVLAVVGHRPPPLRRWPELGVLGALYAVSGAGFLASLEHLSAGVATLVFFTYPAAVVLGGALFLDEPLDARRSVALILTVSGCALTARAGGGADAAGVAMALTATLAIAAYTLAGRSAMSRSAALGSSAVVITVTAAATALFALARGGLRLGGGAEAAGWTVLTGLVATAVPMTAYLVALRHLDAGKVSLYSTAEPVLTVLLAAAVLGERMGGLQLLGGALVVAGVAWLRLRSGAPEPGSVVEGGP